MRAISAARPQTIASMCWLAGATVVALGTWIVCYAPNCAATPFDDALMRWFLRHHGEFADQLFRAVTWLGSVSVLTPFVIASMLVLMYFRRRREAYFLGLALAGTIAIVHISKFLVARPRPADINALIAMPWDQSFPSAHAAQIAGLTLASLIVVFRLDRIWFNRLWLVALFVVILVALSRIYLQVHYPSDVVVGIAVGALWVAGLAPLMLRRANESQKE